MLDHVGICTYGRAVDGVPWAGGSAGEADSFAAGVALDGSSKAATSSWRSPGSKPGWASIGVDPIPRVMVELSLPGAPVTGSRWAVVR